MDPHELQRLAERLLSGAIPLRQFVAQLSAGDAPPSAPLEEATVDLDRRRRCGYPEVIFSEGKSAEAIEQIARALLAHGADVLATRIDPAKGAELVRRLPGGSYHQSARTFRVDAPVQDDSTKALRGHVVVVTAGTSDRPVADEAAETLAWMRVRVSRVHDVGVAGPHRLLVHLGLLREADAVVVVAGMEGALPSVVGGYVACPVIAVPTSVGYGAALGGVAALLGMLNSCAANVTVVNIDAGFKAGYVAGLIAQRAAKTAET